MADFDYNRKLVKALVGRRLRADVMPQVHSQKPMFSFWGAEAGIPEGDIHADRAYRIYLDYDEDLRITAAEVVVDGELLSPCSGYAREVLDEFDFEPVLRWCLRHTEE